MIIKLSSLKDLPFDTYTASVLKQEEDAKGSGFLFTSESPKMILFFIPFVEEIHGKTNKNEEIGV